MIFYSLTLPPRSKLREWLGTHASERKFDTLWSTELWNKRFPHLREDIVEKVITSYKKIESSSEELRDSLSHSIAETYMKLSLLETISPSDLETSIIAESSGKIFDFTDAIMRGNSRAALDILHVLLETMNIYAFIGSIIGLLRGSVYTKYLKSQGKSMREIGSMISLHSFVIQKAYESRIPYEKLRDFYDQIIASNIVYRSGYGLSDPEL